GAMYLFALPIIFLINLLDPDTWGTSALGGWSILIYPCFFVSGFVIISNKQLQASIIRWRWISLVVGILLSVTIKSLWTALGDPSLGTWGFALGSGSHCLNAWCWLFAILGFGMKSLNFNTSFLKYANQAVLPFYILHYTVIVTLGYYIVQWAIPDGFKFAFILTSSFLVTVGLYEFLVRRSNFLRILFGMKPKKRQSADVRSTLVGQEA
ncbi:MAG: hypothetical protein GTO18_17080, partial [Anaerolineales bacterium]|nr:hypothetical protein [Anaerolineales bacterium]